MRVKKASLATAHFKTMSRVFSLILLAFDIKNLNLGGLVDEMETVLSQLQQTFCSHESVRIMRKTQKAPLKSPLRTPCSRNFWGEVKK